MTKRSSFETNRLVTVAVDAQNDFCLGGALAVSSGDEVIDPLNHVMDYTRQNNGLVIATRDWHPATTPHFDTWPVHCVAETTGAAFHSGLRLDENDAVISKGMGQTDGYSGFEGVADDGATIESLLTPASPVERVIVLIGGLATDYCVLKTTLDALKYADQLNDNRAGTMSVVAIRDAMRAVNLQPEDEQAALDAMAHAGARFLTSSEILNDAALEV